MDNFFDERSDRWIKILKMCAVFGFFFIIIACFVLSIIDMIEWDSFNSPFLSFLIWNLSGVLSAMVLLVCSMLTINALNNLQVIRENMEQINYKLRKNETSKKKEPTYDRRDIIDNYSFKAATSTNNINKTNISAPATNTTTNSKLTSFEEKEKYVKTNFPDEYNSILSFSDESLTAEEYKELVTKLYNSKKQDE